jgi:large subunit ribosomal protein L18
VKGTAQRPRLSVFRSNKQIYAQIVDDQKGVTLASASSMVMKDAQAVAKLDQAKLVGKTIAERAQAAGINEVVFDRGGYLYHGRVKSLAEAPEFNITECFTPSHLLHSSSNLRTRGPWVNFGSSCWFIISLSILI